MNTAPVLRPSFSRLTQLENEADYHKGESLRHWQIFTEKVLEIQALDLWPQDKYGTWDNYCKKRYKLSSGRIRQFKAAIPYAEILQETIDVQATEKQIRDCREAVGKDNLLFLPAFEAAHALVPSPQARHFKEAYQTIKNGMKTGSVSVSGVSMPFDKDTTKAAIKEAIIEADKRYKEHRAGDTNGNDNIKVRVTARRLESGLWDLDFEGSLPLEFTFTAYVKS